MKNCNNIVHADGNRILYRLLSVLFTGAIKPNGDETISIAEKSVFV